MDPLQTNNLTEGKRSQKQAEFEVKIFPVPFASEGHQGNIIIIIITNSPKKPSKEQIFNSLLKQESLSRGSYFIDVYNLTANKDGENNKIHMYDEHLLSPKYLSLLFENYLYEPNIYSELTS